MTTTATPAVTPERIMQFAWGYVPPLVLEAAIRQDVYKRQRVYRTDEFGLTTFRLSRDGRISESTGASNP